MASTVRASVSTSGRCSSCTSGAPWRSPSSSPSSRNDLHDTSRLRIPTGAHWTFLADEDLEVQRAFDIREYTDTHHDATVPHTIVLAPGLVIDKVYVGYWFWGRPTPYQLREDLQDLRRRIKPDFDPTTADARAACGTRCRWRERLAEKGCDRLAGLRRFAPSGVGYHPPMKRTLYALLGWITWKVGKHRIRRKVRLVGR